MAKNEPNFNCKTDRLVRALNLLDSGLSIKEVAEITGYSHRYLQQYAMADGDSSPCFSTKVDPTFHKRWTIAVNRLRAYAGLPLFEL